MRLGQNCAPLGRSVFLWKGRAHSFDNLHIREYQAAIGQLYRAYAEVTTRAAKAGTDRLRDDLIQGGELLGAQRVLWGSYSFHSRFSLVENLAASV